MSSSPRLKSSAPSAVIVTLLVIWIAWRSFNQDGNVGELVKQAPRNSETHEVVIAPQASTKSSPRNSDQPSVTVASREDSKGDDAPDVPVVVTPGVSSKAPDNTRKAPQTPAAPSAKAEVPPATQPRAPPAAKDNVIVRNQTIKDLDGKVVYRGDIDLTETLDRIANNKRLRFRNDGSIFQNREKRLPTREQGYYQEWVHITQEVDGPGPQRVVTGKNGEIYYTADHYRTFKKLK